MLLFLLISIFGGFQAFSQSYYADSLENLLKTPIHDTVKVWALNELSREQKEEVIELREELLLKSNEIKDQLKRIKYKIQQEMRKESPNWGYMDELNKRFFALQGQLANELLKYKSSLEEITYKNDVKDQPLIP